MTGPGRLAKPIPAPDALTEPYWDAARREVLAIQRCSDCRLYIHPPDAVCPACNSEALAFETVSGRGRVYSYTVVRDNVTRGFEDQAPYVVALIELEEQERLIVVTNLLGLAPDRVRVGLPVAVEFEAIGEGIRLPQFRVVAPVGA